MHILKNIMTASIAGLILVLGNFAQAASYTKEAPIKKITEMLYPTVMVDLPGQGAGSGTIIFSGKRKHPSWKEEGVWTLVLTNHHVIGGSIKISEDFDPKVG